MQTSREGTIIGQETRMFRRPASRLVPWLSACAAVCLVAAGSQIDAQRGLPSAREIVDRSIKVAGGADAFKAVKSIHIKGSVSITSQNMTGTIESMSARPNKAVSHGTISAIGNIDEGFDGKVGWTIDPMSGPALVTGKALAQRGDDAWFDAPLHAPDYVRQMTVAGQEIFDRRPAYKLNVVLVSGFERTEYYDVETGFLIGVESVHEMPMGSVPSREIFRNFKKYGALMMPSEQVERVLGQEQVVTFTSYEFNTVPDSAFELPPQIKALIK
jgi:hypothetical protein